MTDQAAALKRMAGTVPLASDKVIPETKDDRIENQVHEGMVDSCKQPDRGVVNSWPQPHEGMYLVGRQGTTDLDIYDDLEMIPIAGTAINNTTTPITGILISTNLVAEPQENTVCLDEAESSIHPNPTSDDLNDPASSIASEGEELQPIPRLPPIINRPPESGPQGVPHGGLLDPSTWLYNTCNLDQFVNGQYLICLYRPIRNLLEERAQRFPETYGHLWHALHLCEAGQFAAAKFYLAPLYDMYTEEGTRVMPLIKGQLRHFFSTSCQKCGYCQDRPEIILGRYNRIGGFQEPLRAAFSRQDGTCIQQGCQGRTTAEVRFECGTPPLIIAVNLYYLRRFIPNSQSVDFTEIVELFGERYMMFLFTLVRPDSSENGPGHYMSYVFRPDGGGEVDSDGIPVGNWNWYPNNENGDLVPLTPGQADLEGTIPSYVYFILVPPSSSGGATSSGRGEKCPKKEGEDNEE
ncbi:uncharacterized protein LOC117326311 isoform X2 [Pecten maximus]|uniref:uncharacterized protein LOC117326311 isoform X2 n=1 Tax=Pecten maximus TaxID=6579 RepID=UPI0014590F94|nr:uncharacterized protein LOC117326311 isoform X2 [Pecten maximus]